MRLLGCLPFSVVEVLGFLRRVVFELCCVAGCVLKSVELCCEVSCEVACGVRCEVCFEMCRDLLCWVSCEECVCVFVVCCEVCKLADPHGNHDFLLGGGRSWYRIFILDIAIT